jgi:hypothetical protein
LLDGQEWPHLVAAGTNHPNRGRHQQQPEVARRGEHRTTQHHQGSPHDQHLFPAEAIRAGCDPQRQGSIAEQRRGQQQSNALVTQSCFSQVQHQDQGEKTIREQAHHPRGEQ